MSRVDKALNRAGAPPMESTDALPERAGSHGRPLPELTPVRWRQPQPGPGEVTPSEKPRLTVPHRILAEASAAPVILPRLAESPDCRLVVARHASAVAVERYRACAAALQDLQQRSAWAGPVGPERDLKSLLVTSARDREGKTLTAVNLALTFSEVFDKRVLLIDAHFDRPGVHELLGMPKTPGLADALRAAADASPVQQVTSRLAVLAAGEVDGESEGALITERMIALLAEAVARFDWVLVDAPAADVNHVPALAAIVRAALLVIRSGVTSYHDVDRALAALGLGCVVGTVLNRAGQD